MKTIIVTLALAAVVACGRLDSQYLPPTQSFGGQSNQFRGQSSQTFRGQSNQQSYSSSSGSGSYQSQNQVPILRYDNNNDGDGQYSYAYETGNGISAQEQGQRGSHEGAVTAQGGFSYTGDDGQNYAITYVADEYGFKPQGAHLPTPPPIPADILRSIEQNLAEEARGGSSSGSYSSGGGGGGDDGQYRPEAPQQSYGAPQQTYRAPQQNYGAPQGGNKGGYRY